jgi:hypothetical protein
MNDYPSRSMGGSLFPQAENFTDNNNGAGEWSGYKVKDDRALLLGLMTLINIRWYGTVPVLYCIAWYGTVR